MSFLTVRDPHLSQIGLPQAEGRSAAPLDMGGIGQRGAKRAREFGFDVCLGPGSSQASAAEALRVHLT